MEGSPQGSDREIEANMKCMRRSWRDRIRQVVKAGCWEAREAVEQM